MPHTPHRGTGEIVVGRRVEDDLRNEPVVLLTFQQVLDFVEAAHLVEGCPAHRDKTGIPVPLN